MRQLSLPTFFALNNAFTRNECLAFKSLDTRLNSSGVKLVALSFFIRFDNSSYLKTRTFNRNISNKQAALNSYRFYNQANIGRIM
ncbi:MAG: hypothetical protein O7C59_05905 [Rickettsia endosymbiont of Ixodes persulcatus]|nr:hypothetical protein [Rickettsia endosymbiont of Ixodes persulcatus]